MKVNRVRKGSTTTISRVTNLSTKLRLYNIPEVLAVRPCLPTARTFPPLPYTSEPRTLRACTAASSTGNRPSWSRVGPPLCGLNQQPPAPALEGEWICLLPAEAQQGSAAGRRNAVPWRSSLLTQLAASPGARALLQLGGSCQRQWGALPGTRSSKHGIIMVGAEEQAGRFMPASQPYPCLSCHAARSHGMRCS